MGNGDRVSRGGLLRVHLPVNVWERAAVRVLPSSWQTAVPAVLAAAWLSASWPQEQRQTQHLPVSRVKGAVYAGDAHYFVSSDEGRVSLCTESLYGLGLAADLLQSCSFPVQTVTQQRWLVQRGVCALHYRKIFLPSLCTVLHVAMKAGR